MKKKTIRKIVSVASVVSLGIFLMPWTVFATEPGYFDNPQKSYQLFEKEIYQKNEKPQYVFLKVSVPVYNDFNGSKEIAKAPKYSGAIVVSQAGAYFQMIYERKNGQGIGWIKKQDYTEHAAFYNGAEKQLLADGTYFMENENDDEDCMEVRLKFLGNQQYEIKELAKKFGQTKSRWQLIREYDHFYLKEVKTGHYLKQKYKTIKLDTKNETLSNRFDLPKSEAMSKKFQWKFTRMKNKNVNPYRNFLQYDPAWARKNYGNVKEYSGKIAAAGCGVVAITNAVYALNGQFVDPMLFADLAVRENYRIIGSGTDSGIFKAAAKQYGSAYDFYYEGSTDSLVKVREELRRGCVAISHVPGHYVTVADYNEKTKKYLVLDSHPIASRPTSPFGNWFLAEKLHYGGLASSEYYIFSAQKDRNFLENVSSLIFQKDCLNFIFWMTQEK